MSEYHRIENTSNGNTRQEQTITPETFLQAFKKLQAHLAGVDSRRINKLELANAILQILRKENVNYLMAWNSARVNHEIVEICAGFSSLLNYDSLEIIIPKLQLLADSNEEQQKRLAYILRVGKYFDYWKKYKGIIITALFILFIYGAFIHESDNKRARHNPPGRNDMDNGSLENDFESSQTESPNNERNNSQEHNPSIESGPYNTSSSSSSGQKVLSPEEKLEKERQELIADGWSKEQVSNGQFNSCYNFIPKSGDLDNYLRVKVGGGTDVAIKVMDARTNVCVKYVFINSGTTFPIKKIPEGKYYLKIAYGKEWYSKAENGQCIGKFLRNPMYEKGTDILNYNKIPSYDGYQIPSYELELDVISSSTINSFDSQNISEDQFND
jgi:hypothetical protein